MNALEVLQGVKRLVELAFPGETVHTDRCPAQFRRPASLVQCSRIHPAPMSGGYDRMELEVTVTTFAEVDEYHNSQYERLLERLGVLLGIFGTEWTVPIGARRPEVTDLTGDYGLDYAEVTAKLRWSEEKGQNAAAERPMMEEFHFNREKKEGSS